MGRSPDGLSRRWAGKAALLLPTIAAIAAVAAEGPARAGGRAAAPPGVGAVDDARLRAADSEPQNWLTHGRTFSEQRYSPLARIHTGNVSHLVRVWSFETGLRRGHEATPLVVDGVMFVTGPWSVVFALDARTGELLWRHDPQVDRRVGQRACCDVVNRGVAVYRGRVFVGVLDGRLQALDAATGKLLYEVQTADPARDYTITGAPRVVKGRVIIGNGGAEYGVRGYVSAYDAETGRLLWRTYTVPGNPAEGFESPALERAARTWRGRWWELGGGGTVWDSMAYDPELDLLYVGTGNGSPWNRELRSPGGGDNLYLSSILALDPDDGRLVWHYQTTPGDTWDFTATQHLILADLEIGGVRRPVIMQAPKNGFFYVLDRRTGELLSADPYVQVTWADGVDLGTGRPRERPEARYRGGLTLVRPTPFGGHNWQPMSFSPRTGLVYIPAQEVLGAYAPASRFEPRPGHFNTGTDLSVFAALTREFARGHLLAWDPVARREVWRHPYAIPWNGGTLATGGDLVFQGTADGRFLAFDARTGRLLFEAHTGSGVVAAPITYEAGGTQYVTVVAGWGGAFALVGGDAAADGRAAPGRVLTFALFEAPVTPELVREALEGRPASTRAGDDAYHVHCARCHGVGAVSAGVIADLRESYRRSPASFAAVVAGGLPDRGMPAFGEVLSADEIAAIEAYVAARAAD